MAKAVVGFVLTILGVVFAFGPISAWLCVIALPVAIVGLCLSVSARKAMKAAGQSAGLATAGLVIGIIAVVFAAISFFTCGLCVICASVGKAGLDAASDAANDALNDALENL